MRLRMQSAAGYVATLVAALTVAGATGSWSVTTVAEPAPAPGTVVSVQGTKFAIDGEVTYPGTKVEGMLLNSRMIQAIFDDENPATVGTWAYPDTNQWDPERNVQEFIAQLPNYRAKGLLAVSVSLQGGRPAPWSVDAQPNVTTAFRADGSLKPEWLDRLDRVIRAADAQGIVVILGFFYFGQDHRISNETAVVRGVDNVTDWLLAGGYRNVLVEITNESNVAYDHQILRPGRVAELITRVRNRSNGQLLVSTSFGGGFVPTNDVVAASDYVLTHGNQLQVDEIAKRVLDIKALPAYKAAPKPIVFNEGHSLVDRFDAAVNAGASWGFYMQGRSNYNDGFNSPPVNWSIQPGTRKQTFFDRVAFYAGSSAPPAEICGDGIDNDGDGQVDEGCVPPPPPPEICGDGIDNDGDGQVDEGCVPPPPPEICGNGLDDDGDGQVDEGCPTEPPSGLAVVSVTLMDADADQPVAGHDPLVEGAVVNLATLPTRRLNLRVNTSPAVVGSVRCQPGRRENDPPYACYGDTNGNYAAWTPAVGGHKYTLTAYSGANGAGTASSPLVRQFTVVDQADTTGPTVTAAAPVMTARRRRGSVTAADPSGVSLIQVRLDGELLVSETGASATYEFDLAHLAPGPHVLEIRVTDGVGNPTVLTIPVAR